MSPAALTDHLVHAQTAVLVVRVHLQVLGELVDALGEDGDLDLRRTGVALVRLVGFDDCGLFSFGDHGDDFLSLFSYPLAQNRAERHRCKAAKPRIRAHGLFYNTTPRGTCKEKSFLIRTRQRDDRAAAAGDGGQLAVPLLDGLVLDDLIRERGADGAVGLGR